MASLTPAECLAGRFVLLRQLGAGGMAECWLAEDGAGRELRVLKIATAPDARRALAREAALLAALAHPGVVVSHGAIEDGERLLLVTDYLAGGDLRAARGPDALAALEPALAGLAHAHARGVAHGDLKPANLVRAADGGARLVDFGVAAAALEGATARGSPYSRSPAQWQGAAATPADDLWGLGALLHELVAGHPPFYPDVDAARLASGAPPLPAGTPDALKVLIGRLMSPDPAARGELATARAQLGALTAPLAAPESPAVRAPDLIPAPPRPVGFAGWQPPTPLVGAAGPAPTRRPALALGVALLAAVLSVFVVLPRWVREHPPTVDVPVGVASPILAAKEAAGPRPLPSTPEALADLARAKSRAEEARAAYAAARAALEQAHAELWGGAELARMTGSASEAEARYNERDYVAAAIAWAAATERAPRIRAARAPALAAALREAQQAFARADAAAATAGFQRALAIEANHPIARAGLARASHLDAVIALCDAGAALERQGDLDGASAKFRAALAADPATASASAALARLATRRRAAAFAQAMAQGQKALAGGDRVRARAAFEQALAIEPQAAGTQEALAQLALGDQSALIARQRAAAATAVREERWADAIRAYDAALALDATLVFATAGKAEAEPRAALGARIERLLAAPARLESEEGRRGARALRAEAEDTATAAGNSPLLRQQAAALERAIALAETPVRVTLLSDNLTEVVVYRVARLGAFAARELELLPGRYTIVGRRAGFRDVRRELEIAPGASALAPVDVRCLEPI